VKRENIRTECFPVFVVKKLEAFVKKILVIAVAVIAVASFSTVYAGQMNTGCGLGSIVWKGKSGLLTDVCAVTTNGTSGSQTFGITSGTSNCGSTSSTASNEQINRFMADNLDSLTRDIAQGNGEYLSTFATLMQVNENERAAFNTKLQSNFSRIFTSDSITQAQVLSNIRTVLSSS